MTVYRGCNYYIQMYKAYTAPSPQVYHIAFKPGPGLALPYNINKELQMYELTLIKNNNNTYSFVGSVPISLAYVYKDGTAVSAEVVQDEMLLPARYRKIKVRVFDSFEKAEQAARLIPGLKISYKCF